MELKDLNSVLFYSKAHTQSTRPWFAAHTEQFSFHCYVPEVQQLQILCQSSVTSHVVFYFENQIGSLL